MDLSDLSDFELRICLIHLILKYGLFWFIWYKTTDLSDLSDIETTDLADSSDIETTDLSDSSDIENTDLSDSSDANYGFVWFIWFWTTDLADSSDANYGFGWFIWCKLRIWLILNYGFVWFIWCKLRICLIYLILKLRIWLVYLIHLILKYGFGWFIWYWTTDLAGLSDIEILIILLNNQLVESSAALHLA